jgi:homoserine kinase type II
MLPGTPLALQGHDGELLGAAIGELQAALQHYPLHPRPGRPLFNALFDFPRPAYDPLTQTPAHLGLPADPHHDTLLGWWREEAAQLHAFVNGPYRELPQLMCHNDVTPNNVLAEDGRVTAVLDFEFATPAARALEFVAGMRMILRHWEPGDPLALLPPFCRGYARWMTLTEAEVAALPELLRLRGAITVLWWLGYAAPGDTAPILSSIGNLQRLVRWLDKEKARLVDTTSRALQR